MQGLTATLRRKQAESNDPTFDLGIITDLSCTFSVSVNPSAVVIFGYTGAFAMDMGVTKGYVLSYTRVCPRQPNDASTDTTRWSNAYWKQRLKQELNSWQAEHDGYLLNLTPSDSELFPTISEAGYIQSFTCNTQASDVTKISGSITFTVGRLKQDGS